MSINEQYQESLQYLFAKLPQFAKYGKAAVNNSLDNIEKLCAALGNPHEKLKAIHIAGTNGKGSTSHMLAAILQEAGHKTGLYTSPHLVDFRERIKVNGEEVSKEWVVDFTEKHKILFEEIEPSFFEVTVAMAFQYFVAQECDVVVIETGLGGRLDSTNIITPLLSIITNISFDHTDMLGDTLEKIATEKAGIIKNGIPFIVGERQKETEQIFFEHAIHKNCNSFYADAQWGIVRVNQDDEFQYLKAIKLAAKEMYDLNCDLTSNYQLNNIKTVLTASELLYGMGFQTDMDTCTRALSKVKKNTKLRARWEKLRTEPLMIADVGHNKAGINEVMQQWQKIKSLKKHVVMGFVKDKDVRGALSLFSSDYNFYFCNADTPRALAANDLATMAAEFELKGNTYESVAAAVAAAQQNAAKEDAILIIGSFFVVGEAISFLEEDGNA